MRTFFHGAQTQRSSSPATKSHATGHFQHPCTWYKSPILVSGDLQVDSRCQTLRVFDWISQNLAGTDAYSDKQKIAVCGEDVGGSLAAMLALTESHSARPHISAAAVSNPILDWSDIFPENGEMTSGDMQPADQGAHCTPKANDATCLGISVGGLINMRKDIFRKAEDFFDPFASPMLFFRTACFDLPSHLNRPSSVTLHNQSSPPNEAEHTSITRKRTYLRAYPPSGSGLLLPPMKITFGKEHVLKDQSMEFLSLMQRSLSRGKRLPGMPDETNARSTCVAEERENIGMWDQRLVLELGQWLSGVLRRR